MTWYLRKKPAAIKSVPKVPGGFGVRAEQRRTHLGLLKIGHSVHLEPPS
jgi:hypothetical protein